MYLFDPVCFTRPDGQRHCIIARWDGIQEQLWHLVLHFLFSAVSFPLLSIGIGLGIELRDGTIPRQGTDLVDFAFRTAGAILWPLAMGLILDMPFSLRFFYGSWLSFMGGL